MWYELILYVIEHHTDNWSIMLLAEAYVAYYHFLTITTIIVFLTWSPTWAYSCTELPFTTSCSPGPLYWYFSLLSYFKLFIFQYCIIVLLSQVIILQWSLHTKLLGAWHLFTTQDFVWGVNYWFSLLMILYLYLCYEVKIPFFGKTLKLYEFWIQSVFH